MDKYTLPVCTPVFSDRVEIPKLYEAVLPEYLPNIVRVLKTESIASVDNSQYSDGLLKMQVSLLVRVVHISEQKGYIKTASVSGSKLTLTNTLLMHREYSLLLMPILLPNQEHVPLLLRQR